MIDRQYGIYIVVCDLCGYESHDLNSFDEAVDYKNNNKWQSKKIDNEWTDICPACQLIEK